MVHHQIVPEPTDAEVIVIQDEALHIRHVMIGLASDLTDVIVGHVHWNKLEAFVNYPNWWGIDWPAYLSSGQSIQWWCQRHSKAAPRYYSPWISTPLSLWADAPKRKCLWILGPCSWPRIAIDCRSLLCHSCTFLGTLDHNCRPVLRGWEGALCRGAGTGSAVVVRPCWMGLWWLYWDGWGGGYLNLEWGAEEGEVSQYNLSSIHGKLI